MMEDFEKKIKSYFQGRELKVSDDAWNRMEMLMDERSSEFKKKSKRRYIWTIAASFLLAAGLWTFFKKTQFVEIERVDQHYEFVAHDTLAEKLKQQTQDDEPYVASDSYHAKRGMTEKKASQNRKYNKEQQEKAEQVFVFHQEQAPNEMPLEKSPPESQNVSKGSLNQQIVTQIYVNPNKLLRNADIERQLDNTVTDGKNFWKKVKEINTVVENSN